MLIPILATLSLLAMQDPPADPEAANLALLHTRTLERCESQPRGANETVEACAQRRATALIGTYGSVVGALGATAGWGPRPAEDASSSPFRTLADVPPMEDGYARSTAAAAQQPYQPPQPRCRRESTRSQDGTSSSTTVICGAGGETERAARDMLDRLRQPSN